MMRLNLQLFSKLNTDTSIVDYLKSIGKDSSYTARRNLANTLGIQNYKGSAEQNTQMLGMLKNGTGATPQSLVQKGDAPSPTTLPQKAGDTPQAQPLNAPAVKGVDNSVVDKITAPFTKSEEVKTAESNSATALGALGDIKAPAINPEYLKTLNTPFTASSAYTTANAMLEERKNKVLSGRTSYTGQIQSLMNQIQNRDKFSYDVDTDPLFQQALASAMGSGRQAMQDTMGQASALTGGYASTYAQSAGNQAYNAYIEDAYNNLPEYYQMALEAYNMEGQDMYNQLAMLNDADATEYGRLLDSYNISYTEVKDIYDREYGAYKDNWNNIYNLAGLDLDQQGMAYDQAYSTFNAYNAYADTLYDNEFDAWNSEVNNNTNIMNTQNSDYWNEAELTHDSEEAEKDRQHDSSESALDRTHDSSENALDRQHDSSESLLDREHDSSEAEKDRTHDSSENSLDREHDSSESALDREHDSSENEKDRKHDSSENEKDRFHDSFEAGLDREFENKWNEAEFNVRYDVNGDGTVDEADRTATEENTEWKTPSPDMYSEAVEAYKNGGEAGLTAYLEKNPDYDVTALWDYAEKYGMPMEKRRYTKVKTTANMWGADRNGVVRDEISGEEYQIKDLPEEIRKILTDLEEGETWDFSTGSKVTEEKEKKNTPKRTSGGRSGLVRENR